MDQVSGGVLGGHVVEKGFDGDAVRIEIRAVERDGVGSAGGVQVAGAGLMDDRERGKFP